MQVLYDSKLEQCKKPFGCLRQNQRCEINIWIPRRWSALQVAMQLERADGETKEFPMHWNGLDEGYDAYLLSFSLAETGLYFYYFKIVTEGCGAFCVQMRQWKNQRSNGG